MLRESWAKASLLLVGLCALLGLLNVLSFESHETEREPAGASIVEQNFNVLTESIYKTAVQVGKLPVKIAVPIIVRYKIADYLKGLPLDPAVRARVLARVNRRDFVDAVVPFAWALKEQYWVGKDFAAQNSFESYIKKTYSLSENIPGLRHSLFDWGIKDAGGSGQTDIPDFKLDSHTIAGLVEMYDVLFLRSDEDYIFTSKRIRPETLKEAVPKLQKLLQSLADKMPADSDNRKGIEAYINDPVRLEAIVISAATFLRALVQKNYHSFASFALRTEDLRKWLHAEYGKRDFGNLYTYLVQMNQVRRHAVHIVVDGLQGHLLSALARGNSEEDRAFMRQVLADEARWAKGPTLSVPTKKMHEISVNFLHAVANHPDTLRDERYLPFFKRLYSRPDSYIAGQGVSTTPTISVRNLPLVKTGAEVAGAGGTGIPNFHFVDRSEDRAYYFFGNDALLLEDLAKKRGLRTIFERLPGLNTLNCSAQYDSGAEKSFDALLNLIIGEKSRDFGELLCYAELKKRTENEIKLHKLRSTLMENIRSGQGIRWAITSARSDQLINDIADLTEESMPDYLLMYDPWPDHFAHFKGPFSDEILSPTGELNRLDYWLGRLSELFDAAGASDRTLWAMAGDHGLTPVYYYLNPEDVVFGALKKEGVPLIVTKISSDEGEGPKITHPYHPPSMKGKDVIIASTAGGNYMIDVFNSQDQPEWRRQPVYGDLTHWKTLAGQELNLPEEIRKRLGETLDYMVIRQKNYSPQSMSVVLLATRNGQRAESHVHRVQDRYFYEIGDDLLGVRAQSVYHPSSRAEFKRRALVEGCLDRARLEDPSTWCSEKQWRELTSYTDRPDSVVQIARIYDEDRAGTINLFPIAGIGYNTIVPGRHAGEHFHEKDAFVGFWGKPLEKRLPMMGEARPSVVNGSTAASVYHYLTGKEPVVGQDGWGFPSVFGRGK